MSLSELFYLQKPDRRVLLFFLLLGMLALAIVCLLQCGGSSNGAAVAKADSTSTYSTRPYSQATGYAHNGNNSSNWRYDEGTEQQNVERFVFDPNTADSTQLLRLGLRPWQVRSIYRYRAKGGVFSRPTDFARVYGLTLRQYRELEPYIRIGRDFRPASETIVTDRAERHTAAEGHAVARDTVKYPMKLRAGQHIALNASDTTALKKVPGIGSYYARRIVTYREQLGGFYSIEQLHEIEGMPEEALAYFTTGGQPVRKLNINKLSVAQLRRHPYINYYQARDIVDYRRLHGPFTDLSPLRMLKDFTAHDIERLQHYVEY